MAAGSFLLLASLLTSGPALTPAYAPLYAVAVPWGDDAVLVLWAPGAQIPDAYHIYGLSPDAQILLAEVSAADLDSASLLVPAGYAVYAVAAVVDGNIVGLTDAADPGEPCVEVETTPPGVHYWNCINGIEVFPRLHSLPGIAVR